MGFNFYLLQIQVRVFYLQKHVHYIIEFANTNLIKYISKKQRKGVAAPSPRIARCCAGSAIGGRVISDKNSRPHSPRMWRLFILRHLEVDIWVKMLNNWSVFFDFGCSHPSCYSTNKLVMHFPILPSHTSNSIGLNMNRSFGEY